MPQDRALTVHFNDGSKLGFEFPEQGPNAAAKQLKIADLLAGKHLVIEAEGSLMVIPVTSIKYLTLSAPDAKRKSEGKEGLPRHTILGARIRS